MCQIYHDNFILMVMVIMAPHANFFMIIVSFWSLFLWHRISSPGIRGMMMVMVMIMVSTVILIRQESSRAKMTKVKRKSTLTYLPLHCLLALGNLVPSGQDTLYQKLFHLQRCLFYHCHLYAIQCIVSLLIHILLLLLLVAGFQMSFFPLYFRYKPL